MRITVGSKLALGFGAVLLLFILTAIFIEGQVRSVERGLGEITNNAKPDRDDAIEMERHVTRTRYAVWIMLVAALAITGGTALWIGGSIARSVRRLNEGVKRIAGGDLNYRIPIVTHDELGRLAEAFNRMSEQRHQAGEALGRERHFLHSLMDNLPDSIYFKDEESRFIKVNRALADRFDVGMTVKAIGQRDSDFFTPEHAESARADELEVMRTGQAIVGREEKETWPDGRETWVATTKMPLRDPQGNIIGTFGISRDITQRKLAERRLTTQYAVTRVLDEAAGLAEATPQILQAICESLDWDLGIIWTVDHAADRLRCVEVWHLPAVNAVEFEEATRRAEFNRGIGLPGRVWESRKPAWIEDVVRDSNFPRAPHAAKDNLHGAFALPIQIGDEVHGVLEFFSRRIRRPDDDLLKMFVAIGSQIGQFVERKSAEEALREAEERSRLLLESSADGIYGIDLEGRCTFINKAAAEMIGFTPSEALGRNMHDLIHHSRRDGSPYPVAECPINRAFRVGQSCRVDSEVLWRRDGTPFPAEYSSQPIRSAAGEITGAVVSFADITERKAAEADLQRAKEAAEAATRAKSEFLANMSHEIRTPLNGIIGMTELTLDTEITPEQREYLVMAKTSADHLLQVINDILDFSKIEAGKLDLESIDFALRDTLDETLATLAHRAHKKGLELLDDVLEDVPDSLVGDPGRLRQIVVNLVGNAIKFTERGEIVVRVERQSRDDDQVTLHFAVRDTGIGIPRDRQQVLFQAFSQVDSSTTRRYGGTGLGLAISSQLVQLMHGRIWMESEPGQGSTFHFTVRFGVALTPIVTRLRSEPVSVHGLSVLVVDDNATNRRILQEMLTKWQMKPTVVDSAVAALRALEQSRDAGEKFDLVLLDAMMPDMDGFELIERIKRDPSLTVSTMMMLSSADRRSDAQRCRELGLAAYLTKPVCQSDLLDATMTALGQSRHGVQLFPAASLVYDKAPRPLSLLLVEDNAVNQTLARRLLEKRGHSVEIAGNGRQALAMLEFGAARFDAVLMDVQMPEMDGFEATAAIREQELQTDAHLPIIAMTAHAMKDDRERCLAVGMDGYVSKPLQPQALFAAVEDLSATAPRDKTDPPVVTSASPIIDKDAALDRVGGDVELLKELIGVCLGESSNLLEAVRAAIAERDVKKLRRAAHTLKGAISNFGHSPAVDTAEQLEAMGKDGQLAGAPELFQQLKKEVECFNAALAEFAVEPMQV